MNRTKALAMVAVCLNMGPMVSIAEERVDFAREVLPILSNKCFVCHGPDAKEDELRLDSFEAATADRGGYRAIDPAALDASHLSRRIQSADEPMPPVDAEKQLTVTERDTLTRWVKARRAVHEALGVRDSEEGCPTRFRKRYRCVHWKEAEGQWQQIR